MSASPKGTLTRQMKDKLGETAYKAQAKVAAAPRGSPLKAASLKRELDNAKTVLNDTPEDDEYEGIKTITQMHRISAR